MSPTQQEDVFTNSEGDRYFQRNKAKLKSKARSARNDPAIRCLNELALKRASILEIGCSNGWRLEALRKRYRAKCFGIDPANDALRDGRKSFPNISFRRGTAENLPYGNDSFDLVIFGFCLYLCSREHLFKIAYEADRVLRNEGIMALLDFHPPFPYRNPYKHDPAITVYKMDYSTLFTWNPAYTPVSVALFSESDGRRKSDRPDERASVVLLQKNTKTAYPDNPWAT